MLAEHVVDQPSGIELLAGKLEKFNKFWKNAYSRPNDIVDEVILRIYDLIANNQLGCGMCMCLAITSIVSATCLGVGIGVGLGVGCNQVDYVYLNSTLG